MKIKLLRTTAEIASYQVENGLNEPRNLPQPDSGVRAEPLVSGERRSFLGLLTGLIGAGISGLLGITLGRFSIAPALSASSMSEWIDVATENNEQAANRSVLVARMQLGHLV